MPSKTGVEASNHSAPCSQPSDSIQGVTDQHPLKIRGVTKLCHNCGLPNWAISRQGITLRLRLKAEGSFRGRDRRLTVWCCGEDCAWQALAIAAMGPETHKWPIRFREFISLNPELLEQSEVRSDCNETPISDPHKQRGCEGAKTEVDPYPCLRFSLHARAGVRAYTKTVQHGCGRTAQGPVNELELEKVESQLVSREPTK